MSDLPTSPPSDHFPGVPTPRPAPPKRPGLITYAGLILAIAGALSLVVGLMGLTGDRVNIDAPFLEGESGTRIAAGVLVVQGALALLAGWLILRLRPAGRTLGLVLAVVGIVSGLAQLGSTGSSGFLTLALDAFVLYGLLAYGYVFKQQPRAG
jgi:hypothetical protein